VFQAGFCIHCGEAVGFDEDFEHYVNGISHRECAMRAILGSVAHIEKRCSCYVPGSQENDPPGLSRREAAKAAVKAWNQKNTN
jgi:hypothetical protein